MNITEKEFKEYVKCQRIGYFNMLDYGNWKEYTSLSKEKWFYIITHYSELRDKYNI